MQIVYELNEYYNSNRQGLQLEVSSGTMNFKQDQSIIERNKAECWNYSRNIKVSISHDDSMIEPDHWLKPVTSRAPRSVSQEEKFRSAQERKVL